MGTLNVRPGLSAPLVNSIPSDWDPQWFRRFITDYLNLDQVTGGGGGIGVTSLSSGAGIGLSGSTGAVTISNAGVTSIIAGTGITITPTNGLGDVTVNGNVAAIGAGPGISVSSSIGTVNWTLGFTSSAAIIGLASDQAGNTLAVDFNGIVYKSTDGGKNWASISTVTLTGSGGVGGSMAWAAGVFVLGNDPTSVKRSTDGGLTWTSVATGITGAFTPGYVANNGSGVWVVTANASPGTNHCYSVSTDNANTFSIVGNTSTPQFPNAPPFWDGAQFVSFDAAAPSVLTSGAGHTWIANTSNSVQLQWVSLADSTYVCATQAPGNVRLATSPGGLGVAATTGTGLGGNVQVTLARGQTIFAFDQGGTFVAGSLDGGSTWALTASNFPSGDQCSATTFDPLHSCFIAGGYLGGLITTANSVLTGLVTISITGGFGTVTSVDASVPSFMTISGNPITSAGTLVFGLATQSPNLVFAGPTTGAAATPTFRSLVAADLPLATTSVFGAVKPDGTTITISGGVISSTGGGGASGANPTASVGLTAVNGTATTFLRSDGAPPLSQAIAPTWTGTHAWTQTVAGALSQFLTNSSAGTSAAALWRLKNDAAHDFQIALTSSMYSGAFLSGTAPTGEQAVLYTNQNIPLSIGNNSTARVVIAAGGNVSVNAAASGTTFTSTGVSGAHALDVISGSGATTAAADLVVNRAGSTVNAVEEGPNIALFDTSNTTVTLWQNAGGQSELWQYNAGWQQIMRVLATRAIQGLGPVGGMTDMTPDASTFTGTLTGMTATITNTCRWSRNGNQVALVIGAAVGTSNANTLTMMGLPAAIQPAHTQLVSVAIEAMESGSVLAINVSATVTASSGTITFSLNGLTTGWGSSLGKGVASDFTVAYLLN